jgi:plastocyanin
MTSTTKRGRLVAAGVLLLGLVSALGACADDDGGGGDAGASGAAADGGNAVAIEDFTFKPGELRIEAGTTVTFTNEDGFAHTATAKDPAAKDAGFDSGNLEPDATFEHTFAEAGTFEYFCAIHNSMTGTVTVS